MVGCFARKLPDEISREFFSADRRSFGGEVLAKTPYQLNIPVKTRNDHPSIGVFVWFATLPPPKVPHHPLSKPS